MGSFIFLIVYNDCMSFYFSLGCKKDCFTFGFDLAEDEEQVNIYSWSGPPGLREQTDEVTQAIRNSSSCLSTFQRTTSSSSFASNGSINKPKRKKVGEKNTNVTDQSAKTANKAMPAPPSSSMSTASSITVVGSATASNNNDQSTTSKNPPATNIGNSSSTNIDKETATASIDIDGLLEENKSLREENLLLKEQIAYEKENAIRKYRNSHLFLVFTFSPWDGFPMEEYRDLVCVHILFSGYFFLIHTTCRCVYHEISQMFFSQ
jgi:hypothetical protein